MKSKLTYKQHAHKSIWVMLLQKLEEEGNRKTRQGAHAAACELYADALQCLAACSPPAPAMQLALLHCSMAKTLVQIGQLRKVSSARRSASAA